MKVLVLGATGGIGRLIVRGLQLPRELDRQEPTASLCVARYPAAASQLQPRRPR